MSDISNLETWQCNFVKSAFADGMRVDKLGNQPSPWILRGLTILEKGEDLTPERIKQINLSGGTDHPDPTLGI